MIYIILLFLSPIIILFTFWCLYPIVLIIKVIYNVLVEAWRNI